MTIEIRELVIEARIRDGSSGDEASPWETMMLPGGLSW